MTNLTSCRTPMSDSTSKDFLLICCIAAATCWEYFAHLVKPYTVFSRVSPQRFRKQRESSGPRGGHAASNTRPAAVLCNPSNKFLTHCYYRKGILPLVHCFVFSHCQDCYILDNKGSNVMVWKGKQASKEERQEALNRAVVSLIHYIRSQRNTYTT